ncbi:MAG: retropepsin-like aspartic protease [Bacteroidales bacterium]
MESCDTSIIAPILAPDFAVSTRTWSASGFMLQQIFTRSKLDCTAEITDKEAEQLPNGDIKLELKYTYPDTSRVSEMVLNRDGKIKYLDLFDEQYGLFRKRPSKLIGEVHFEFRDGEILLKVRLNDNSEELEFLFDTGTDGMAINPALAKEQGMKVSRRQNTSGVGANMEVQISSGNTMHIGPITVKNRNFAILNHALKDVDGIVGVTLANNLIIQVNFDDSKMYFYSLGTYRNEDKEHAIPITIPSGLPVVEGGVNISGEKEVPGRYIRVYRGLTRKQ